MAPSGPRPSGGGGSSGPSLVLASIVALSVYVPFEWVAKATLLVSIYLFVVDPVPPYTRLLSLVSTVVVSLLNSWYQRVLLQNEKEGTLAEVVVEEEGRDSNDDDEDKKKK
jgi:hypothetical protein